MAEEAKQYVSSGWEPIGFVLDGEDWESGEVGFILKTDGRGVTIHDLRKAAAAPEMFEALKACLQTLSNFRVSGPCVVAANAAIAKATGEQP